MAERPGVRFDLAAGRVTLDGAGVVLLPAAALAELARSASSATVDAMARAIGRALGQRAAASLAEGSGASVDAFASAIGVAAASFGVGAIAIERWGRAMVVVIERTPLPDAMLAPAVGAAVHASTGREVSCALLTSGDGLARVLIASRGTAARVRSWIESGMSWGDALARLHVAAQGLEHERTPP